MTSRPLQVLITTGDRAALRALTGLLSTFGYKVLQAAETNTALAAVEGGPPDVALVDAEPDFDAALALCRRLEESSPEHPTFTFLICDGAEPAALLDALEAGVGDFLTRPLVYGELLVRLRAAARTLEFERRLAEQRPANGRGGLLGRRALEERLRQSRGAGHGKRGACVAFDVDFLDRLNRRLGTPVGDLAIRAVFERVGQSVDDGDLLAGLGGGRFAVYRPEAAVDAAVVWAEGLLAAVAEEEFDLAGTAARLTLSAGVAPVGGGSCGEREPLGDALEALGAAKASGRNCVVHYGQFDEEAQAWQEQIAPGRLLERTVARDLMSPCTLVLRPQHTLGEALCWLRRTRLVALPVVDRTGKLLGVLGEEQLPGRAREEELWSRQVADAAVAEVGRFHEESSFAELLDHFTRDRASLAVVVSNGRPVGLVTATGLASITAEVRSDTFAPEVPYSDSSEYLLIGEG